jgi:hypothetical protein
VDIFAVRSAIADAARAVTMPAGTAKLTSTGYATDAVTTPQFYVGDYTVTFDQAFRRGQDDIEFTCAVLVSRSDDLSGQRTLDALLSGSGPSSLKTAIEVARGAPGQYALGGLADDLHVTRVQSYRWYEVGGTQYLGAELVVRVIGEGDTS